jgi:hypothetical protein
MHRYLPLFGLVALALGVAALAAAQIPTEPPPPPEPEPTRTPALSAISAACDLSFAYAFPAAFSLN